MSATGARGYQIIRKGKKVICRWAGIYVLGPSLYYWRRKPAETPYRCSTEQEAKKKYRDRIKRLGYSSEAYVPLGPGVKILYQPRALKRIRQLRDELTQ